MVAASRWFLVEKSHGRTAQKKRQSYTRQSMVEQPVYVSSVQNKDSLDGSTKQQTILQQSNNRMGTMRHQGRDTKAKGMTMQPMRATQHYQQNSNKQHNTQMRHDTRSSNKTSPPLVKQATVTSTDNVKSNTLPNGGHHHRKQASSSSETSTRNSSVSSHHTTSSSPASSVSGGGREGGKMKRSTSSEEESSVKKRGMMVLEGFIVVVYKA